MAKDQTTPEDKLLQIIDNPTSVKPRPAARLLGKTALVTTVTTWLSKWKPTQAGDKPMLTIPMVNRGLAVLCGLLTIAWIIDFLSVRSDFRTRLDTLERIQLTAPVESKGKPAPAIELADLLATAKLHNIFTFLPQPKVSTAQAAAVQALDTALKDLKLVGIIWSEHPQAIIEQTKDGKTSLVGTGESIGPFRIKKIGKDKIVLNDAKGTQEWELQ